MIEINGFGKDYGEFTAVESLDLTIPAGEIFGFIGPNGAGKSTTIRYLATLLKATRGRATVNGFDVEKQPMEVRRSVGYMPDAFGVYDGMRVWEFLDFFAVAYSIPKQERRRIIGEVLDLVDLTYKRDDFVNGLSRGMKQRLCLAKTLVHDPPVLILDEPASGLDPRARVLVKELLLELQRMGKTILISSHILTELADVCSSIGIIERGKLLMHGPIGIVYRQIRSHRQLEIRVLRQPELAESIVGQAAGCRRVSRDGLTVSAEVDTDETGLAALLSRLMEAGVGVNSFADLEPSLEDVFMTVTRGIVN
ncbi:MAG TPA: ABC transporter ATP-binding protein [Pirellulaceae bacterium]|nr:ABC transporter ATP-binding protein [Pirellulaceae bacterium]